MILAHFHLFGRRVIESSNDDLVYFNLGIHGVNELGLLNPIRQGSNDESERCCFPFFVIFHLVRVNELAVKVIGQLRVFRVEQYLIGVPAFLQIDIGKKLLFRQFGGTAKNGVACSDRFHPKPLRRLLHEGMETEREMFSALEIPLILARKPK